MIRMTNDAHVRQEIGRFGAEVFLGGRRAYAHVSPTSKIDVFVFHFCRTLGVARPMNNGLAVIIT